MCGRFTLRTPAKDIAELFHLAEVPDLRPRYNIAPTQPVAAVRVSPKDGHRELVMLHWGLIPFWADDPNVGYSTINARAVTISAQRNKSLVVVFALRPFEHQEGDNIRLSRKRTRFSASFVPTRMMPLCRWITTQSRPQMFQTHPPRRLMCIPKPSRTVVLPISNSRMSTYRILR
jgi:putative SOS response-associated peptidase YedK